MEIEDNKQQFPFKNANWDALKKKLKQERNQRHNKNIKQINANESASGNQLNYMSIEGPPAMIPAKKYCDITGFETKYKDKNTGLYYYDKYVYKYIQGLTKPVIDEYLKLRKINITN